MLIWNSNHERPWPMEMRSETNLQFVDEDGDGIELVIGWRTVSHVEGQGCGIRMGGDGVEVVVG